MKEDKIFLFVYGTLMKGEINSDLLKDAEFIKSSKTKEKYTLINLGAYPAVVKVPQVKISGELYSVTQEILKHTDKLEGYPHYYDRELIELDGGEKAIMYFLPAENINMKNASVIECGNWKKRPN